MPLRRSGYNLDVDTRPRFLRRSKDDFQAYNIDAHSNKNEVFEMKRQNIPATTMINAYKEGIPGNGEPFPDHFIFTSYARK
jgi:hypothetical protein